MSEEMNKEAEVQEEAVDIPVTDGNEDEAADTAQTAEEEASEKTVKADEAKESQVEAESQKEPESKTKASFFGKKKKEKDKFEQQIEDLTDRLKRSMAEFDNYRKRTEKKNPACTSSVQRISLRKCFLLWITLKEALHRHRRMIPLQKA